MIFIDLSSIITASPDRTPRRPAASKEPVGSKGRKQLALVLALDAGGSTQSALEVFNDHDERTVAGSTNPRPGQ